MFTKGTNIICHMQEVNLRSELLEGEITLTCFMDTMTGKAILYPLEWKMCGEVYGIKYSEAGHSAGI